MAIKYFDYLDRFSDHLEKFLNVKDLPLMIETNRKILSNNPNAVCSESRRLSEITARAIANKHGLNIYGSKFVDIIHALAMKQVISPQVRELFDTIRKSGNKGAHENMVYAKDAELAMINLDKVLRFTLFEAIAHKELKKFPTINDEMVINERMSVETYSPFEQKLIYIQSANNESGDWRAYEGKEKIGDASVPMDLEQDFRQNSDYLRIFAKKRINQYMTTAGVPYDLHWAELAVDKEKKFFRDYDVHEVLKRSGIPSTVIGKDDNGKSNEWFEVSVEDAKKAIQAVKEGRSSIHLTKEESKAKPIKLRSEQLEAIKQTRTVFKKKNHMLWNAKMRFGKTLSALQLIKEGGYKKVLIMTHRPIVSDGWFEDFGKIFTDDSYTFGSKNKGESIKNLLRTDKPFVYFASIQDLRGSKWAGGKQGDKNHEFTKIPWDMVIIDEAHEGNETDLANNVKKGLLMDDTKILELSGTPFNLLEKYDEDNVFTWDYTMEQEAKYRWELERPNEPNPYEGLPKVSMYTFEIPKSFAYFDESKAFNFKEFFRADEDGNLVHEADVVKFLDYITTENETTNFPFSKKAFRENLRHTLWLLPGVKEANALEKVLKEHPVFSEYTIANVVQFEGTSDENHSDLDLVRNAIGDNPAKSKTITLTVRKLTTGVNVPEWTGVFFLNNTESPTTYLQAAFRAQTPFNHAELGIKTNCYVFDFAPDRALKIMTESVGLTSSKGKINKGEQVEKLTHMLNFLPILGQEGNVMREFSVDRMMTQLKKAYAEKAVRSGFEDNSLYNDNLLRLGEAELDDFKNLKEIVGSSKAKKGDFEVVITDNGLTEEEHEKAAKGERKPKKERSAEEEEAIKKLQELKKQRSAMISILRGISIRIPMMIYGMDVDFKKDIEIKDFVKLVDEQSWHEFMPKGFTKEMFKKFVHYYDPEVFIEAGRIIRQRAKSYDQLDVIERTEKIAELFGTFKNPDKETVLTPWRVVNLQLIPTLGGLSFFDDSFENTTVDGKSALHWVETKDSKSVWNDDIKILDINAKTGLYPLFAATSLYYKLMEEVSHKTAGKFDPKPIWEKVLKENIYALAKTPMAATITRRTLSGYEKMATNVEYIEDLVPMLKKSVEDGTKAIRKGFGNVKFDVVIGNPPYQEETEGNNRAVPIYNLFMDLSYSLSNAVCLITPARFLFNAGQTPKWWNEKMLSDEHLNVQYFESFSNRIFPNTDIKGGVAITFRDATKKIGPIGTFITIDRLRDIANKIKTHDEMSLGEIHHNRSSYKLEDLVYSENPNLKGRIKPAEEKTIGSNVFDVLPEIFTASQKDKGNEYAQILGRQNNTRVYKNIKKEYVAEHPNFKKWKVFVAKSNGRGDFGETLSLPEVVGPYIAPTQTFISFGAFDTEYEAISVSKYLKTKFVRALLSINKATPDNARKQVWEHVPLQDFTENSDIDWRKSIQDIDQQLYKKYGLTQQEVDFIEEKVKPME